MRTIRVSFLISRIPIGLILAVCTNIGLYSSELVVRNLHFDVEFLPTDFDYEIQDSNGTRSGSDAFSTSYGIAMGARYSFARTGDAHGFLIGAQLLGAKADYKGTGTLTDLGLRAEGGYGYALNDQWTVNALARLGYGWSNFDLSSNAVFPSASLSGTTLIYGAAVGIDWEVASNWQINSSLGYMLMNYDLSGSGVDMTVNRGGLSASIGFLYRLSNLPSRLE
jgi:Outer membrane protein beta-barrel domain